MVSFWGQYSVWTPINGYRKWDGLILWSVSCLSNDQTPVVHDSKICNLLYEKLQVGNAIKHPNVRNSTPNEIYKI